MSEKVVIELDKELIERLREVWETELGSEETNYDLVVGVIEGFIDASK